MCAAGFLEEIETLSSKYTHTHKHTVLAFVLVLLLILQRVLSLMFFL